MSGAELIEQLKAEVQKLRERSPTPRTRHGNKDSDSTGSGSVHRTPIHVSGDSTRTSQSSTRSSSKKASDGVIVIDVGGVIYRTMQRTLKCVPSSYFAEMLNYKTEVSLTEAGHVFVDRNGELFGFVLEYLRDYENGNVESLDLPTDLKKLTSLKREAQFYRLRELTSSIEEAIQERKRKEEQDNEAESTSSVIVRDDEIVEKEFDIIFKSISSSQCQFSEEAIQDLVDRVNYAASLKQAKGFKINNVKSDVVFDPTKNFPFSLFMHITLSREKRHGSQLFSPTEQTRPSNPDLYPSLSYPQHHRNYDQMSNDGVEYMGTPRARNGNVPFGPPPERSYTSGRRFANNSEIEPETVFNAMEYRVNETRGLRGSFRPRYGEPVQWDYENAAGRQSMSMSPRGTSYAMTGNPLQRKPSGRTAFAQPKVERLALDRVGRRDAWVNQTPSG